MAETIKINNEILEYNKIIYVDTENGDDASGDGSKRNPYKTLEKALNDINEDNQEAIYLRKGTYYVEHYGKLIIGKRNTDYIGEQNTIIKANKRTVLNYNMINNFYRIIFKLSDSFPNTGCVIWLAADGSRKVHTFHATFNNCVFDGNNRLSNSSRHRGFFRTESDSSVDYNIDKFEFNNCIIINSSDYALMNDYNGNRGNKIKIINCATTSRSLNNPNNDREIGRDTKVITSLVRVKFDSDYNILSSNWINRGTGLNPDGTQAHIGVFGGPFAWGDWKTDLINQEWIPLAPSQKNFENHGIVYGGPFAWGDWKTNSHLIKDGDNTLTFDLINQEWIPLAPSQKNFENHEITDFSNLIINTSKTINFKNKLGSGQIFKESINFNAYKIITNIKVI